MPAVVWLLRIWASHRHTLQLVNRGNTSVHRTTFGSRLAWNDAKAEVAQATVVEPSLHHFEGGNFLADEQDSPTFRQGVRDDVRNRLALAGSRWSIQNEADATPGGDDGFQLTGIAVKDRLDLSRCDDIIQRFAASGSGDFNPNEC